MIVKPNEEGNSENLIFILHRTNDILKNCEDKIFGKIGLTTEQYMVLSSLKCLDKPVKVTDVARRLTRSVNSISMIVDRMVKAGLLKRIRDKKDRRVVWLTSTSKAEALLRPAIQADLVFVAGTLSPLGYEWRQTLHKVLLMIQQKASEGRN